VLIGLHGRKLAGKDTVYERARLAAADDIAVDRASFADLLYESAAAAVGVTVAQLREWKANDRYRVQVAFDDGARRWTYGDVSVREYLQNYGTEAHRDLFGPDFWVDNVRLDHEGRILMVTDVRFPNEAEAVRRAGGFVVNVVGPDEVENAGDGHASETPLPHALVDATLYNDVRDDGFRALDERVGSLIRCLMRMEKPGAVEALREVGL
jgi:hypothetical protein